MYEILFPISMSSIYFIVTHEIELLLCHSFIPKGMGEADAGCRKNREIISMIKIKGKWGTIKKEK